MTVTMNETLPAVDCTPWCHDGTGHTGALHPDDQWCYSDDHTVKLTRMPVLTSESTSRSTTSGCTSPASVMAGPTCTSAGTTRRVLRWI